MANDFLPGFETRRTKAEQARAERAAQDRTGSLHTADFLDAEAHGQMSMFGVGILPNLFSTKPGPEPHVGRP
jgi:hypothetical protein